MTFINILQTILLQSIAGQFSEIGLEFRLLCRDILRNGNIARTLRSVCLMNIPYEIEWIICQTFSFICVNIWITSWKIQFWASFKKAISWNRFVHTRYVCVCVFCMLFMFIWIKGRIWPIFPLAIVFVRQIFLAYLLDSWFIETRVQWTRPYWNKQKRGTKKKR